MNGLASFANWCDAAGTQSDDPKQLQRAASANKKFLYGKTTETSFSWPFVWNKNEFELGSSGFAQKHTHTYTK